MARTLWRAVALAVLVAGAAALPPNHKEIEQYIFESEALWAEACMTGNRTTTSRILAEDFLGTWRNGTRYTKADMQKLTSPTCRSNHMLNATIVFEGDAVAFAFGSEEWVMLDGAEGSYVWTDVWVVRDGRWVIRTADDFTSTRHP